MCLVWHRHQCYYEQRWVVATDFLITLGSSQLRPNLTPANSPQEDSFHKTFIKNKSSITEKFEGGSNKISGM